MLRYNTDIVSYTERQTEKPPTHEETHRDTEKHIETQIVIRRRAYGDKHRYMPRHTGNPNTETWTETDTTLKNTYAQRNLHRNTH